MKYFTMEELTRSDTAVRHGINNTPPTTERANLVVLVDHLLDPLREMVERPVLVNSGYRCQRVNKLVGSDDTSQHIKGRAADIVVPGLDLVTLYNLISTHLDFDQLIYEFGAWIHVSYVSHVLNRKQRLLYKRLDTGQVLVSPGPSFLYPPEVE